MVVILFVSKRGRLKRRSYQELQRLVLQNSVQEEIPLGLEGVHRAGPVLV